MLSQTLLWIALLAPGNVDQPRLLYEAGSQAFRVGKYDLAIDAFESARALDERAVVDFALGQAYRLRYFKQGAITDLEAAVAAYRRYLELEPDGDRAVHATQHLSTIEPFLESHRLDRDGPEARATSARLIVLSQTADATASVDGGPEQPVPATFEVEPGTHAVEVTAHQHLPARSEAVAVAGTAVAVSLNARPKPGRLLVRSTGADLRLDGAAIRFGAEPVELDPGAHTLVARARGHRPQRLRLDLSPEQLLEVDVDLEATTQRYLAWGTLITAGVFAVGSLTTGLIALDAEGDAQDLEARLGQGLTDAEFSQHDRLRERRDDYASASLVLGVAGSAALISGLALLIFDDPEVPEAR